MNSKAIQRRDLIKLASGLLAFPLGGYAGLSRAQESEGQKPLRLLTLPETYGLERDERSRLFIRSGSGDYTLKPSDLGPTLQPLSAYTDNIAVISNLVHTRRTGVGGGSDHDSVNGHVLGGSRTIQNGSSGSAHTLANESVDVAIANFLGESGLLPSNRLYSHLFFTNGPSRGRQTLCYDTEGTQIRSIAGVAAINSTVVGTLSGGGGLTLDSARLRTQQDILGLVSKNVTTLKQRLRNENFDTKLDAFNTGVSDLADQIEERFNVSCDVPEDISSLNQNSTENIFRLIAQTFACDSVTSLTYNIGDELANSMSHNHLQSNQENREVNELLGRNFHTSSHSSVDAGVRSQEIVRTDQSVQIAKLLDVLSTTPEANGNDMLMDNTLVFMPSVLAHNTHSVTNPPMMLIAGKNTNIVGGRHYDGEDRTTNDLLTTVAQGLFAPFDRFGGNGSRGYVNNSNNGPIDAMLKARIS